MERKVVILGTGGFALELTEYIKQYNVFNKINKKRIEIIGYLDINKDNYDKYNFEAPFLGHEQKYDFTANIGVYIAIGDIENRKKILKILEVKKVIFDNFIHHTAIIPDKIDLGKGNIICPNVIISPYVKIGSFNVINYNSALPHDCIMGDNNVFSPNVQITGYCTIGNNNLFGVSSGCTPNIRIGSNNKIQAGLIVNQNIEDSNIVFSMSTIKKMKLYK